MTSHADALPDPALVGAVCVGVLALIVAWDAWWLTRQRLDIPEFGELANSGFAWSSDQATEAQRQWANMISMAAMMVLPWGLKDVSDTPTSYILVWDALLALHMISLLIPKRYAVTKTHLFADGQRYEWSRLKLQKRQPKKRIMLLRKNWGPFGPLPLGGKRSDLKIAITRISGFIEEEE